MNVSSFLGAALFAAGALLSSCEQKPAASEATTTEAAAAPAASPAAEAAVYECPMQCEGSRSTKPGKCPVCAMDLEKKS